MRRHHILIPLAALLATLPLILHGCSCGHDFDFHLQSWLDAAVQMRHGTLYPHWAYTPAFNAGEPRFVFYPPISWLLGATLSLVFPFAALPAIYTWIAFAAAGFTMHHLARHFASPNATLIASILYLANPYMLFNAFERTAYAELLAAAWIPLLLLAALRRRPTTHGIAIPLALLWLTNAPAAVMGSYTFALVAIIRVLTNVASKYKTFNPAKLDDQPQPGDPEASSGRISGQEERGFSPADLSPGELSPAAQQDHPSPFRLATTYFLGTALGLALPAFYLIPAAYERRYVQIAMAIIPNMRIQDNFLFGRTADAPHNAVLRTVTLLAITLLALTFATTLALLLKHRQSHTARTLATLTCLIAFMLTPASLPLWLHLPELAFLQFSWRLLTILAAILCFATALLFTPKGAPHNSSVPSSPRPEPPNQSHRSRLAAGWGALLAVALPLALTTLCIHLYRQPCAYTDAPTGVAQSFNTHHGVPPTDEYTPTAADNDSIRPNNPAYWLSPNANAYAPDTTPNPGSTDLDFDGSFPTSQTLAFPAPHRFTVHTDQPEYLILNLRDYVNWDVNHSDPNSMELQRPPHITRDDGLIAIPLYYGSTFSIDIAWHTTFDQHLGYAISALALLTLAFVLNRNKRQPSSKPPLP